MDSKLIKEVVIKKFILLFICLFAIVSCSGGGGGGGDGGSIDLGTAPVISTAWICDWYDPNYTPITQADIGDDVRVIFCVFDPDLNVNYAEIYQYHPPASTTPYSPPVKGNLPAQQDPDYCYYYGPARILGPSGDWRVQVKVRDSMGNWCSPYDIAPFIVDGDDVGPVANAGDDQVVTTGSVVNLNGSGSTGGGLMSSWSFISVPTGSSAILSDSTAVNPSFTADIDGTYEIRLVVTDSWGDSAADQVTVRAHSARNISLLDYVVSDAEYSKQLDKIIMVSSSLKQLHIYDPKTEENKDIDLPLTPICVSVSPDGLYAAVGHDGWISYVNLTTAVLEKTFSVSTDVLDIVLAGNGYVYAFPRRDQWENIRCVEIATEIETLSIGMSIYAGTLAKLHPNGDAIYGADNGLSPSDIEKYSVVNGTADYLYDSPYHGDYAMCGDLWISEDGLKIFTRCGNVFHSSDVQSEDMTHSGSLSELSLIEHLSHSSSANKVISIPAVSWIDPADEDTEIQIYDYASLAYEESTSLPFFIVDGKAYPGHGRYVFFNSDGSEYYVVMQADETSGMLYDFSVVTY